MYWFWRHWLLRIGFLLCCLGGFTLADSTPSHWVKTLAIVFALYGGWALGFLAGRDKTTFTS